MEKFEKNDLAIALNVLYAKNKKIYPAYVSEHNTNHEKQVNILMIPNRTGWYYITVKKLPALLRRITSKHHGHFYFLNCLHSFATENKCESCKKVCQNKDFCNIVMPSKDTKSLINTKTLIKRHFLCTQILNV